MSPEVSCSGELEKVVAPKGTVQATHDTETGVQPVSTCSTFGQSSSTGYLMTTLDKALVEYARGEHRSIDLILNEIKTAKNFPVAHQCFFPECLRLVDELPDDLVLVIANLFLTERQWFTLEPELVDQCICLLTCISLRNSSVLNQLLTSACSLLFSVDVHLDNEDTHRFPSQYFELAAKCLRELVLAIPQAEDQLLEILKMSFPSWRRPTVGRYNIVSSGRLRFQLYSTWCSCSLLI
ncbi:hypothetical protein SprV_0200748000 [Sparganum proliferum]